MKDGVMLLIVGVVGIVGVFLWRSHIDPFHPAQYLNPPQELRSETEPAPPPPAKSKTPVLSKRSAPLEEPREAQNLVESAPAPVAVPAPPVVVTDPPPFPRVEQIAHGAPEDAVTEKFGNPAISALTSANGHVVGTYVYSRDGGRSATVIHLEDGKVESAATKVEPKRAPGISIPRLKTAE